MSELTKDIRAKRVAVAKDVLARLNDPTCDLEVRTGNYLVGEFEGELPADLVPFAQETCTVCALGAAVLALAAQREVELRPLMDEHALKVENIRVHEPQIYQSLDPIFGSRMRKMIETAFEQEVFDKEQELEDREKGDSLAFGKQFKTPRRRLRAIYENIVANDGEFRP